MTDPEGTQTHTHTASGEPTTKESSDNDAQDLFNSDDEEESHTPEDDEARTHTLNPADEGTKCEDDVEIGEDGKPVNVLLPKVKKSRGRPKGKHTHTHTHVNEEVVSGRSANAYPMLTKCV